MLRIARRGPRLAEREPSPARSAHESGAINCKGDSGPTQVAAASRGRLALRVWAREDARPPEAISNEKCTRVTIGHCSLSIGTMDREPSRLAALTRLKPATASPKANLRKWLLRARDGSRSGCSLHRAKKLHRDGSPTVTAFRGTSGAVSTSRTAGLKALAASRIAALFLPPTFRNTPFARDPLQP